MKFTDYYKSGGKIQKFTANTDLPLGIKKGDAVYVIDGKAYKNETEMLPFDVLNRDKEFFTLSLATTLNVGDYIRFNSHQYSTSIIIKNEKKRKCILISKKTILEIVDIIDVTAIIAKVNSGELYVIHFKLDAKKPIYDKIEPYWYLSSTGTIKMTFIGDNSDLDNFRKNTNNFYVNKKLAEDSYNAIMLK